MDNSDKPEKERGTPLADVVVAIAFVVAMTGAIIAWRRFAGVPVRLAVLLGLPTGCFFVFGAVGLLSRFK